MLATEAMEGAGPKSSTRFIASPERKVSPLDSMVRAPLSPSASTWYALVSRWPKSVELSPVTWLSKSSAVPTKKLALAAKASLGRMTILGRPVSRKSPTSAQMIRGLSSYSPRGRVKREWRSWTVPYAFMWRNPRAWVTGAPHWTR